MSVTFTESAAERIKTTVGRMGGQGLRLGVRRVGCNGLAYTFDVARDIAADDAVFEGHDTRIVIDAQSLPYLDGSQVDFVREGFKELFTVNNPNAKSACGCGESFNVD